MYMDTHNIYCLRVCIVYYICKHISSATFIYVHVYTCDRDICVCTVCIILVYYVYIHEGRSVHMYINIYIITMHASVQCIVLKDAVFVSAFADYIYMHGYIYLYIHILVIGYIHACACMHTFIYVACRGAVIVFDYSSCLCLVGA